MKQGVIYAQYSSDRQNEQSIIGQVDVCTESLLEGMAEYYSANLAQNVLRGLHQRAELGKPLDIMREE